MMNLLRDVAIEDKEKILQWRNLPEVASYMYTDHTISPEEHEKWFQKIMQSQASRYWIIVCDGQDVGLANIYDIDRQNKRCYWAFYIASPDVRGKGVGSFVEYSVMHYVFNELGLNKLCCEVLGFNEAVVRMHNRFGFKEEGLFRQHIIKDGQAMDVVCMAILREEWLSLKPEIEQRLQQKGVLK